MTDKRPIGIFDSGIGGITVLRALREKLIEEDFVYLGDTARLPYGTKSPETVIRYARQAAKALIAQDVKLLVVACNTASAVAIDDLAKAFAPVPVIGVVEPGASAALAASHEARIAVIATESTARGGAYGRAIRARVPHAEVIEAPATVFVALAEEGWTAGDVAEAAVRRYLTPLFETDPRPDTLVLGCTHFPVLAETIREALPKHVAMVDSATTVAEAVAERLEAEKLKAHRIEGRVRFLATDGPERFARVGRIFLGEPIDPDAVEVIDL